MITTTVSLDITPGGIEPVVHVSQYDVGSRTLLFDFGSSYSVPDGASVSIRGTKPDKTGFAYPCTMTSGKASVVVQDQMTACAGRVPCEVLIELNGARLHSATLVLVVKPSALADDTKISESDLSILELAGDISQSVRAAATSAASAKSSETNAVASQKAAATSASAAAVSESSAASHLSDVEDSASLAKSAASSAKTSATNAAASASAAAKSASSITPMTGATASAAGKGGTVPAPAAGKQDSALKGDGTYSTQIGGLDLQLSSSFINTWKSILGGVINVEKLLLNYCHPVGSLYISEKSTDPGALFGGTWVRIKDKFILAAGDSYSAGSKGGEATHTLTEPELPRHWHPEGANNSYSIPHGWSVLIDTSGEGSHDGFTFDLHTFQSWIQQVNAKTGVAISAGVSGWGTGTVVGTDYAGGNVAHNNMPPYEAYYVWKRTA